MGYFCDRTVNELVIMRERSENNNTKSRFDRKHLLVYGTVVKKMPRHSATAMRVGGGGGRVNSNKRGKGRFGRCLV